MQVNWQMPRIRFICLPARIPYFYPTMRWLKILVLFAGLLLTFQNEVNAQLFAGYNAGPILGRTLDAGLLYYPKNEDWIAVSFSGGYTFHGPLYFARREAECLKQFKNGGWHMRLGLRNGLTTDHHANHPWWGLDLVYSRQNESARINTCDAATAPPVTVSQSVNVMSAALNLGYTWNPLRKKTIFQRFVVDFGLRFGYSFWSSAPLLGERDYVSGLGFSWFPIRKVTLEPIAVFRWELFHDRYGYHKARTVKRFK